MILGFAHVTVGCYFNGGYGKEYNVPSPKVKWDMMTRKANTHRIAVGFPSSPQIELVEHDTGLVKATSRINICSDRRVQISTRDLASEVEFLSGLGQFVGDAVLIRSALPKWNMTISIKQDDDAPINPPFDIGGYAALAFYSTDAEDDTDRLRECGGRMVTNVFGMRLGEKDMLVSFLRSPEGTIVELIQIKGLVF